MNIIFQVNAFEVGPLGASLRALYPRAYLLAHDCTPNTTHTDDGRRRLSVRAARPIVRGQAITLSYAYTLQVGCFSALRNSMAHSFTVLHCILITTLHPRMGFAHLHICSPLAAIPHHSFPVLLSFPTFPNPPPRSPTYLGYLLTWS